MEVETLLKNGSKKQRISGGFMDDIPVTTDTGSGGSVISTTHGIDRLSSLPNPQLIIILSLIPIKNAAATSALSHRWRHLWTHHPNLTFDSRFFPHSENFFATVDHILRQLISPDNIKIFRLEFYGSKNVETRVPNSFLETWVPLICARNVEKIKVSLHFSDKIEPLKLPNCVFRCKSLVELSLSGKVCCEYRDDEAVTLDNLKNLDVYDVIMDLHLAKKLLKSCPKLETLSLNLDKLICEKNEEPVVVDVVADCLKSFSLCGLSKRIKFVVDAPSLENINVHGPFISFVTNPIGLLDVVFTSACAFRGDDYENGMLEFLGGISSARKLHVFGDLSIFEYFRYVNDDLSFFSNLAKLSLSGIFRYNVDWDAPVLSCLLAKLKKVRVEALSALDDEINFVEYVLKHANVLEELYVTTFHYDGLDNDESESRQLWREYNFCRQVLQLSKSSPHCHIEFYGDYIRASSDGLKDGLLDSKINILGPNLWRDNDYYDNEDEDDVNEDEDDEDEENGDV